MKFIYYTILFIYGVATISHFATSTHNYLTDFIDSTCEIKFNRSADVDGEGFARFSKCDNMTVIAEDGQNHTLQEYSNCLAKCYLQLDKVLDKNGNFDENVLQSFYEKHSDAEMDYISRVIAVLKECAEKARKETDNLKEVEGDKDKCFYYGSFEGCAVQKIIRISLNATLAAEFCGKEISQNSTESSFLPLG